MKSSAAACIARMTGRDIDDIARVLTADNRDNPESILMDMGFLVKKTARKFEALPCLCTVRRKGSITHIVVEFKDNGRLEVYDPKGKAQWHAKRFCDMIRLSKAPPTELLRLQAQGHGKNPRVMKKLIHLGAKKGKISAYYPDGRYFPCTRNKWIRMLGMWDNLKGYVEDTLVLDEVVITAAGPRKPGLPKKTMVANTPAKIRKNSKQVDIIDVKIAEDQNYPLLYIGTETRDNDNRKHSQTMTMYSRKRYKVWCDCEDFYYRRAWALAQHGATEDRYRNIPPPDVTNPTYAPGLCKHLYKAMSNKQLTYSWVQRYQQLYKRLLARGRGFIGRLFGR